MELMLPPASPPAAAPQDFRFDSAATSPYATAPSSPHLAGNPFLAATAATAPPSPIPFDFLPPASPRLSNANPFDLFQHFTSAPASPARAAAIYAHFGTDDGRGEDEEDDDDGFQPRASYSTTTSAVPFDWEEKPGTPKNSFAAAAAAAALNGASVNDRGSDFEFGVLLDKAAPPPELTAADELFDKGKIRPLKPPPRLHDGGSVGSSPRSPKAKAALRSPRRPSRADFDPFAAALLEATKSPSPLGPGSSPKKPDPDAVASPATATKSGGRRRWRLSDLLLFRSSSEGRVTGSRSKDPVFKYSSEPSGKSVEPASNGHGVPGKHKEEGKKDGVGAAPPHRPGIMGCVRLKPGLYRLARGLNGYSSHFGRATTGATKG